MSEFLKKAAAALPLSYGHSTEGRDGSGMYCDWCRRRKSDGARLRYFSSSTIVCERSECGRDAVAGWEQMIEEMAERERDDREWEDGTYHY